MVILNGMNETRGPSSIYQGPAGLPKMTRQRGFTLIEVMIVVVIIAILAAVAIPAYNEQVRKTRRADAIGELGRLHLDMERWRADRSTYVGSGAGYPAPQSSPYYTITIPQASASATGYTLSAAPQGGQASDTCGTLTMVVANGVATKNPTTTGCWNR